MNSRELPQDRLATTDVRGNRIYLYPADVKGKWNRRRSYLSSILILVFLFIPWIKIGNYPAILFDIPNRRFAILGLTFWAHDAPILFFVVGSAILFIAFVTAIWGRVWCGWACPQTVFVEHMFRKIERWIEGDSVRRKALDEGPLSFEKFWKKVAKWSGFLLLSLMISHSFLAYFVGTDELGRMMKSTPSEHPVSFLVMIGIVALILFDFGWFREQFCTVVCPYGRFQSVLMDSQSSVIAYDMKRGEPRKGTPQASNLGDCVNCYRCVQVCPTGIDIRRGVQLECIACTACMDACDDVMTRLKKPIGLIRYGNQSTTQGLEEKSIPWMKRTRSWIYLLLLMAALGGLTLTASNRPVVEFVIIRSVGKPYEELPNSQIVNHFKADLRNQTFEPQEISFVLNKEWQEKGVKLIVSNHKNPLNPGELERADIFIQFPRGILTNGRSTLSFSLEVGSKLNSGLVFIHQEAKLIGPFH